VAKALRASEKATKARKKSVTRNRRNREGKTVSSDEDVTRSASDNSESSEDDPEVEVTWSQVQIIHDQRIIKAQVPLSYHQLYKQIPDPMQDRLNK